MIKLLLIVALGAIAVNAGGLIGGYGGGLGYGFNSIGKGLIGYGHYGYRPGHAMVQVHHKPLHYQYGVHEHGPGYHKYIKQMASFHPVPIHPIGYGGIGIGGIGGGIGGFGGGIGGGGFGR